MLKRFWRTALLCGTTFISFHSFYNVHIFIAGVIDLSLQEHKAKDDTVHHTIYNKVPAVIIAGTQKGVRTICSSLFKFLF